MKCFLLAAISMLSYAQAPAGARQVYVMPMAGGLDQYLAAWLTRDHALLVVTDPKAADVILTDRIGEAFEQKLAEMYPPEKPLPDKTDKDEKKADEQQPPAPRNTFRSSAPRGTVFLVDTKSRQVVWSDHEKPLEATDANLNRVAERIAKKLAPAPAK